jgi:subtilisin
MRSSILVRATAVGAISVLGTVLTAASGSAGPPSGPEGTGQASSYIVVLKDEVSDPGAVADQHARSHGARVTFVYTDALRGYAATMGAPAAANIARDPRVDWVEPDKVVTAFAQTRPTGINRIDADSSTQLAGNGGGSVSGPAVAVIDTGIDLDHPDLNVIASTNCSGGGPFKKSCGTGGDDDNGHGSHVAGTIGAKDDSQGAVGVAPGVPLVAVKVLNKNGSGYTSWIVAGIDWVAANAAKYSIKVANMSLGGSGSDDGNCGNSNNDAEHKAICNLVKAKGVTLVVAAGNSAKDFASSVPAAYNEAIAVTAVADFNGLPGGGASSTCRSDVDDTAANFSNWAVSTSDQDHTIAAPGVCIYSTWKAGGYNTISGTSMASPHVAGTVALCLSSLTCSGTPNDILVKLRADAAGADLTNAYGFREDPNSSPVSGRYYGYLEYAGGY